MMYHVLNTLLMAEFPRKTCFETTLVLVTSSSFFNLVFLPLCLLIKVLIHLHLQQLPLLILHLLLLFLLLQTFQTPVIEPIRNIVGMEIYKMIT